MAGALIGALRVTLGLDATYFEEGTKGATRAARKLEKDLRSTGQALSSVGQKMTLGITAPLTALAVGSVKAAMESKDALAQIENTIKTMGNAAGLTADQLKAMASKQMHDSLYDDDEILRQVTNTMLTFGQVSGDTFERAQQASIDLSAKFGKDLQGSAIMVGKALNDPIKGVTALTRVGISFTEQQKEQIKAMMKVGNVAGAQKLILSELERQVKGSAKTAAEANPFTELKHAWDDFQEDIGGQLLKILPPITDALKSVVSAFSGLSPEMQKWAVIGGLVAAALGPLLMAFGSIITIMSTMVPLMVSFGGAISGVVATTGAGAGVMASLGAALGLVLRFLGPIGLAAGLVYEAWKHWDTIGPILANLWASIQATIGPPLMDLLGALSSALTAIWNGPLGEEIKREFGLLSQFATYLVKGFGPEIVLLVKTFGSVVGDVIGAVAGVLRLVGGLLSGDWSMAWAGAKQIVTSTVDAILNVLNWLVPGAKKAITDMVSGIAAAMGAPFRRVVDDAKKNIHEITDAFAWMYDKVVGHSYVPDMVTEIAAHMGKLDESMAETAKKATNKTTEAFRKMQEDVRSLFADLFPDAEQLNEYNQKMALIARAVRAGVNHGGISADEGYAARMALAKQRSDQQYQAQQDRYNSVDQSIFDGVGSIADFKGVDDQLNHFVEQIDKTQEAAKDRTAKIIVSFSEMARDVVGSLRGMVNSFKKGDILGGIQGILDMVSQVASLITGIKGGTQSVRQSTPFSTSAVHSAGFSTGGNFRVGGSGGVDSQLVQFRASPGEMVDITRPGAMKPANDQVVVVVTKGEMFDAHVERVAKPLAQDAAMRGAMGGAAKARIDNARMRRNALG